MMVETVGRPVEPRNGQLSSSRFVEEGNFGGLDARLSKSALRYSRRVYSVWLRLRRRNLYEMLMVLFNLVLNQLNKFLVLDLAVEDILQEEKIYTGLVHLCQQFGWRFEMGC
ncbi:serine/threonine kinase family protein [Trifolium medium]|uniref:Serine/threonine kinase family protein n=1 Tax=Trifolium medium TaxID=97028 RepID=A0A392QCK9_9FABA|nr:serine/threonine kinase family protein [Trifolium medium]